MWKGRCDDDVYQISITIALHIFAFTCPHLYKIFSICAVTVCIWRECENLYTFSGHAILLATAAGGVILMSNGVKAWKTADYIAHAVAMYMCAMRCDVAVVVLYYKLFIKIIKKREWMYTRQKYNVKLDIHLTL